MKTPSRVKAVPKSPSPAGESPPIGGDRPRVDHGSIAIRGVTQNNLKNISLDLPLNKLNVITGPSGSGKSSLAFQTIYAEGQRRYVETFSPYTRQFFDRMDKPRVEEIRGIPPAIAIAQSNTVRTSRSTVGTMTEINDYLKLFFPRLATGTCPSCGQLVQPDTPQTVAAAAYQHFSGQTVLVTLPVPVPDKTNAADFFPFLQAQGYLRVLLYGETLRTDEPAAYKKTALPPIVPVIQDRIKPDPGQPGRFLEAIETAFHLGKGKLSLTDPESGKTIAFSKGWHCAECDIDLREPSPALFTFNNPIGACPTCRGFGRTIGIDLERALPDKSLSIRQGVVKAFSGAVYADSQRDLEKAAKRRGISLTEAFDDLDPDDQQWIMEGEPGYRSDPESAWESGEWYGVRGFFDYLESKSYKMHVRVFLSRFRTYTTCRVCQGTRLQPEALAYKLAGHTLPELWQWPITSLTVFMETLPLPELDHTAQQLQLEITSRLRYLEKVGLGYLNLDRSTRTLSGGEVMRVTLTTCLGASLVNTLFVLDEPSVGLHPRDTGRLIDVMHHLRDKGNTLLVVEHEESVMRAADNLIEIGPGRGELGGELVFHGPHTELPGAQRSLTADYLLGRKSIAVPEQRRKPDPKRVIQIQRAAQNNLQRIDVSIPLNVFCTITGVSGSGKSTLIHEVLYENLLRKKGLSSENEPGRCRGITGDEFISRVIMVDQSPPSRTPRSTPAVYTGAWDHIRSVFAATDDAVEQEVGPGYFSFNSGTGRCGRCQGAGYEKVEMQFLSDLYVKCPECEGKRFRPEALAIHHHGKNIHEVLEMTVTEAIPFFLQETETKANKAAAALKILAEVGLGYLRLGQPLNTLSGGESQRLKLVGHLLESSLEPTLFILDEPTTGLHFDDINLLLQTFQRLVNEGHSLIVIEHNLEVIKCADWVIDLGPEAGAEGGRLVAEGTPEQVARIKNSHTGHHLAEVLVMGSGQLRTAQYPLLKAAEQPVGMASPYPDSIRITGAREHNLKNISVSIPRDQLVVVTGLSGSGKSTLAFDIVFAEGQRRFLDSMSTYARQFVEQMEKPEVDHISGLPPTVAIEQRITRGGGKSTVATVTEIYHFLRLLYAKVGTQHCPDCHIPVTQQTPGAIATLIRASLTKNGPLRVMAPLIRGRKGFHDKIAGIAARAGCEEMWIDGKIIQTAAFEKLARFKEHTIDAVTAHLTAPPPVAELDVLVARTLELGRGVIRLLDKKGNLTVLNTKRSCPKCSRSFDNLDPRLFSFNSPHGACAVCRGYGTVPKNARELDTTHANSILEAELLEEQRRGTADDTGSSIPCTACHGSRLNEESRNVYVHGLDLGSLTSQPVSIAGESLKSFTFTGTQDIIARDILTEIEQRLNFLREVGLGYLQLNRAATTLSGGESQRIRLASQLGSNLRGVLYVLDEPTIGLHPRDNVKLLDTLIALRDKGNSLLVVEHDEDTMRRSDLIIDLGPAAGQFGGEITALGSWQDIQNNPRSVTGQALRHPMSHPSRGNRRDLPSPTLQKAASPAVKSRSKKIPASLEKDVEFRHAPGFLTIIGARANNLKNIDVAVPLGRLTVLSGISGSGKSSLMRGVIHPAVHESLSAPRHRKKPHLPCDAVEGIDQIEAVYEVDQSPIGKTSRSTPATYIKVFDEIRALFASLPAAKMRGYSASRFSFNTEGGRCEACGGNGFIKHEMAFLPTSHVVCSECKGQRYNAPTLEIDYHGKNIGDVMNLTIAEAAEFFKAHSKIARTLNLLTDTGTGYLKLGQPSPTLSGGEAQRLKLVAELSRGIARTANERIRKNRNPKGNLYLIEEPTIGLHPTDVAKLIDVLHRLVDDGHTVMVIEHNLDVIAEADFVIDIGPEAGAEGGRIVAMGTPEQIAANKVSRTAPFLAEVLRHQKTQEDTTIGLQTRNRKKTATG